MVAGGLTDLVALSSLEKEDDAPDMKGQSRGFAGLKVWTLPGKPHWQGLVRARVRTVSLIHQCLHRDSSQPPWPPLCGDLTSAVRLMQVRFLIRH